MNIFVSFYGMSRLNPSIGREISQKQNSVKTLDYYVKGIREDRDHYVLSEAITLLESTHKEHRELSLQLLSALYASRIPSLRIGITGSPGVGKSTFIDNIAGYFVEEGRQVGILTIDPSSTSGQGSILGDKTRMESLARDKEIFIRPSPSNRHLGGLNRYTYEAMILCESAGIDRLLVETVGVGQSEVEVSAHADITIMLILPGSGDSLQGIKKGVLEKADLIIIHKADGDGLDMAKASIKHMQDALKLRRGKDQPKVLAYSSMTSEGRADLIEALHETIEKKKKSLAEKRDHNEQLWLEGKNQNVFEVIKYVKEKLSIDLNL